jgi:ribosomal protein S18 acetylase RimI-like enzyme
MTDNDEHDGIDIVEAKTVDEELVAAFARLTPQLSSSAPPPSAAELRQVIESAATTLLLARDRSAEGSIVGSLVLVLLRIPTGVRAWIEDVVIDASCRGRGIGEALNREAIRLAQRRGARTVELTSRPGREAANRLYQRLGFTRRETNVYRYSVEREGETPP